MKKKGGVKKRTKEALASCGGNLVFESLCFGVLVELPSFSERERRFRVGTGMARANCLGSLRNKFEFRPKGTANS